MFLAVGASYLLRGILYGLNTLEGISFVGVSLLFLAIALLAAYPPSLRALRVDPIVAYRWRDYREQGTTRLSRSNGRPTDGSS
jgi:ABC-type antimicrobial peptide transport system permease subunit